MKRIFKYTSYLFLILFTVIGIYAVGFYYNWYGKLEGPGTPVMDSYPISLLEDKISKQDLVSKKSKQILFGDTHVHTTYSTDAFLWSLPVFNGEGPHPISDACDYARFC